MNRQFDASRRGHLGQLGAIGGGITMAPDPQVDLYLDAASAAIGIALPPAHRPGIRMYFELAAGLAAQVNSFELPVDADPAPLYLPGHPESPA